MPRTKKEKNPFENAPRLLLPLWSWSDEFEDFLVMDEGVFHVTDLIDNPWEQGTDTMYTYYIDYDHIRVKCFFYQDYYRDEDETETTETTYLLEDTIFTKWITSWEEAKNYKEWKLTKDQKKWHDELERLSKPHLIDDDKKERTPEALAKIKSYLFYQTLGKEKAKEFIELEIKKLWKDKKYEEDIKELKEIMETWTIKRSKHYMMLYCMKNLREIAIKSWNPELEKIEKLIKDMEEDDAKDN